MTFFDEYRKQITCQPWLDLFEEPYFLDRPKRGGEPRNQTSDFVESKVCSLLTKAGPLSRDDLSLIMAWKIGEIDHRTSEIQRQIVCRQGWRSGERDRYGRDFSPGITFLSQRMPSIVQAVVQGNPKCLFDLHPQIDYFGPTYILTVLFFVSGGRSPIYDRFAHVAAIAISRDLPPGSHVSCREVQSWPDFQQYMNLLRPIIGACLQPSASSSMFVPRPLDRALWVYGHLFGTAKKLSAGARFNPRCGQGLMASGIHRGLLVGRIRDTYRAADDGWRRREIDVKQDSSGYPAVGDVIDLIDSSGATYRRLRFVNGARYRGHTSLGQGKKLQLKEWFVRNYPIVYVKPENVYFDPTGNRGEYRIYTESEWKAGGAAG
jgi:hypothetical protein